MVKINSKLINIRDFLNVFYPVGSYYETSDTSYEYPFDHTAEQDQFLYFWVV